MTAASRRRNRSTRSTSSARSATRGRCPRTRCAG
jgi:hypothetical protein